MQQSNGNLLKFLSRRSSPLNIQFSCVRCMASLRSPTDKTSQFFFYTRYLTVPTATTTISSSDAIRQITQSIESAFASSELLSLRRRHHRMNVSYKIDAAFSEVGVKLHFEMTSRRRWDMRSFNGV